MSITNNAPVNAVPVTVDADGNLTGSDKLRFNPATGVLRLQGNGATCLISLGENAISITLEADAQLTLNLNGLPDSDPRINGRVWDNGGVLTVSHG